MSEDKKNKSVLACVNGHPPSSDVIDYACWLSQSTHLDLSLLHVIDQQFYHHPDVSLSGSLGPGEGEQWLNEIVEIEHEQNRLLNQKAKIILDQAKQQILKEGGNKKIHSYLRRGKLLDNINDLKEHMELVCIGKYGQNHGRSSEGLGHKVEHLIRNSSLPLFVVSDHFKEPKNIMIGIDGSKNSHRLIDFFVQSHYFQNCNLELIYMGDEDNLIRALLDSALAKLSSHGFKASSQIVDSHSRTTLYEFVEQSHCDIFMMGAFGHGFLHDFFLGSLTLKILQHVKKPILLIR